MEALSTLPFSCASLNQNVDIDVNERRRITFSPSIYLPADDTSSKVIRNTCKFSQFSEFPVQFYR